MTRKFGVNSTKYTFTLNVNHIELDKKLGCTPAQKSFTLPKDTTPIDVIVGKESNVFTFLDPEKKSKRWMITMIESMKQTKLPETLTAPIKCWWCHMHFTQNPLGCPIKHITPSESKSYYSHSSKKDTSITRKDKELGYYLTKGYFCSWGCLLSYGESVKNSQDFHESIQLIYMMFYENGGSGQITPAPHYTLLQDYGGPLSIEEYRSPNESYTNTNNHYIRMVPIGELYNVKSKF